MFENYENEYDRNRATIAMLIEMVTIDNRIDPIEKKFLADIARQLGLLPDDIAAIIKNPEKFALKPPASEEDRMRILYYLLFMMRVDGKIPQEEEKLCYKAGLKLGFNEQLTGDLIGVMKTHLNEEIPPEAMINVVKKYLN
jgi:hypothetical protein